MAEEAADGQRQAGGGGSSLVATIAAVLVLTLLAVGAGVGLGFHLFDMVDEAARLREANRKVEADPAYTGKLTVRSLPPIITSLADPRNTWVRIEASIVFEDEVPADADRLAAQIAEDSLSYLRTVSLRQIEGAAGLLHLRDDLNERAAIRSDGRVRELIIQTLAVE